MNKRRTLMIALGAAVGLFALILGALFFIEPKGGTPIIIKGIDDGSGGESITIEGLQPNAPSGKGDVSTIKVTADGKWWSYKSPALSTPMITVVTAPVSSTDPADCKVDVTDLSLSSTIEVKFDSSVFNWSGNRIETKKCTTQTLVFDLRDFIFPTECKNSDGTTDCQLKIDVSTVKELKVEINGP